MEIKITLSDPNVFYFAVKQAVTITLDQDESLSDYDKEILRETYERQIWKSLNKFVNNDEEVTIQFNTKEETAQVLLNPTWTA